MKVVNETLFTPVYIILYITYDHSLLFLSHLNELDYVLLASWLQCALAAARITLTKAPKTDWPKELDTAAPRLKSPTHDPSFRETETIPSD